MPANILQIVESRLMVVMINLSDSDDPYLIFESLNFKGSPLEQADLVRNYFLTSFAVNEQQGGLRAPLATYAEPLGSYPYGIHAPLSWRKRVRMSEKVTYMPLLSGWSPMPRAIRSNS